VRLGEGAQAVGAAVVPAGAAGQQQEVAVEALHRGPRLSRLQHLPPYSPDLNPIELAFAKLKGLLREAAARTREALCGAIAQAIDAFTPAECSNYLRHDGYASTEPSIALACPRPAEPACAKREFMRTHHARAANGV
jgi:hypothetical protein